MASGQPALQTLVLRVSIHCHGCKKKIRKVLKSIQGVQDVEVDAQQHKVVVTGTVDAETLLKKLYKSGKQALPWQHTPAVPAQSREAPAPAEDGSKDAAAAADKKPAEPMKEPQADDSSETASEKTPETEKEAESEKKAEKEEAKHASDEAKKDGGEAASESAAAAKEAGSDDGEAEEEQSKPKDAPAAERSLSPAPAPAHAQQFSPYNEPQPVMSYHMAQPGASVSYYAPQPEQGYSMRQQPPLPQPGYSSLMQQQAQPMQQQWSPSYLYMPYPYASPESYYYSPPGTHASPPPPPPLQDSDRLFDDENPNSCSVM